jgi:gluconolactonase
MGHSPREVGTKLSESASSLGALVSPRGEVEVISAGYTYTEGPVWDRLKQRLLFHDVPGDTRYEWSEESGTTTLLTPTNKSNGMCADANGRLLICESTTNRLVRHELDGSETILAEKYEGKHLNSPNDVVVRGNGDVYFSDPAYGRLPIYGEVRPRELDYQGVFRVRASDASIRLVATDCEQPNGLVFSPDGSRLYVDDCELGTIWSYDLDDDGNVIDKKLWREDAGRPQPFEGVARNNLLSGYVDGMGCDEYGNVYVTSVGGILVMTPDGHDLGKIELPEDVANFTWGGPSGLDLFICCRSFIGRLPMTVRASNGGSDRLS